MMTDYEFKLNETEEKTLKKVFNKTTKAVIKKAKDLKSDIHFLFNYANYDEAFSDGFKSKSHNSNFNLYIDSQLSLWKPSKLWEDSSDPQGVSIHIPEPGAWRPLMDEHSSKSLLSPRKMASAVLDAIKAALADLKYKVKLGGEEYKVTLQDTDVLRVEASDFTFTVRIISNIPMEIKHLKLNKELQERVEELKECGAECKCKFRAVASLESKGSMFEVQFPHLDREILKRRGCLKEVEGVVFHYVSEEVHSLPKMWVHLLHAYTMMLAENHPTVDFWCRDKIDDRLLDFLRGFDLQLQKDAIPEPFFQQVQQDCIFNLRLFRSTFLTSFRTKRKSRRHTCW